MIGKDPNKKKLLNQFYIIQINSNISQMRRIHSTLIAILFWLRLCFRFSVPDLFIWPWLKLTKYYKPSVPNQYYNLFIKLLFEKDTFFVFNGDIQYEHSFSTGYYKQNIRSHVVFFIIDFPKRLEINRISTMIIPCANLSIWFAQVWSVSVTSAPSN